MRALAAILAGLSLCGPAAGQDFHAGDFRAARAAAVKAVNAGDFTTAEAKLAEARAMVPWAPSVLLLGAQIEAAAGKPDAAKPFLAEYVARGLWFDRTRYADLAPLMDSDLIAKLDANAAPLGTFTQVARSDDLRLVEGLAVDTLGRIYLTTVHHGALNALAGGAIHPMLTADSGQGAYGLGFRDGVLWLALASNAVSEGYDAAKPAPSEVARFDLKTSRITYFPADSIGISFGDIALGQKDIYVSDGAHGGVFRLKDSTGPWQTLIAPGTLGSPQDMVESQDAKALAVADYTSGLYRIDLTTGAVTTVTVPADASVAGIDGMAPYGNDLIAVQNGINPARVLRLHMSPDWQAIDKVEVLLRGPDLDQPTGGQVVGDDFFFVARSQWSDFDDDGKPLVGNHGPVVIGDLKLNP